jgi:hypothetical protein
MKRLLFAALLAAAPIYTQTLRRKWTWTITGTLTMVAPGICSGVAFQAFNETAEQANWGEERSEIPSVLNRVLYF